MLTLHEGQIYYIATFIDAELKAPVVQTLRYLEKGGDDENPLEYFDQIEAMGEVKRIFIAASDVESLVLDFEGLLTVLQRSFDGDLLSKDRGS